MFCLTVINFIVALVQEEFIVANHKGAVKVYSRNRRNVTQERTTAFKYVSGRNRR